MKIGVRVLPRKEVLDSQGRTVMKKLEESGFTLNQMRVGKFFEIEMTGATKDEALSQAKKMATEWLYNPLIETFEVEILESK